MRTWGYCLFIKQTSDMLVEIGVNLLSRIKQAVFFLCLTIGILT